MRILVSVSDKTGLKEFLEAIQEHVDEIYATGGTQEFLRNNNIESKSTSELTGVVDILGGRVKTLHPAIFAGILSRRTAEDEHQLVSLGYRNIDMVIANLYPFEKFSQSHDIGSKIENIDIGGVALIRAAAKNYQHVAILSDPSLYSGAAEEIAQSGSLSLETRERLALEAFYRTSSYDSLIYRTLSRDFKIPEERGMILSMDLRKSLRYGENPDQKASLYTYSDYGIASADVVGGKAISYNNYLDADAAFSTVMQFNNPACVIVKHLTPCGASEADSLSQAFVNAYSADSESAFGSVVAFNQMVDSETAAELIKHFIEVVVAPSYAPGVIDKLTSKKKKLRILIVKSHSKRDRDLRSIWGGVLMQDPLTAEFSSLEQKTSSSATDSQMNDMLFAWKVSAYCKSNAIVLAKNRTTVGIGAGQTSRVRAMRIALDLAGEKAKGAVAASDGFFPFADNVELAATRGIKAIIEPGGSIRDGEVVEAAERAGVALYFTGKRVFRH